jgi:hypothetical protein
MINFAQKYRNHTKENKKSFSKHINPELIQDEKFFKNHFIDILCCSHN